jgi:D-alanine-D-alanine ligase
MVKTTVAVLYGSRSPEHEVSIITALQVMQNLDSSKYQVVPIYISKSGNWILGNSNFLEPKNYKNITRLVANNPHILSFPPHTFLQTTTLSLTKKLPKIDVVFPVFHGAFGEDGTLQGLLEMLDLPYVGCNVVSSALGMDKLLQKQIFAQNHLSQVNYIWFYRDTWKTNPISIHNLVKPLSFPLYVKPANGGSSIGITKVKTADELADAIDVASCFDRKIIVEESAENFKEINISVLGNSGSDLISSVCEQPVPSKEVLTFQDKYESGNSKSSGMASAKRLIPAPISPKTATKIADFAKTAFSSLDCSGVSRVDFLVSPDEKTIYINEINTIPGSLAFYLWEASGLKFPHLLDKLITLALTRYQTQSQSTFTFQNNLLSHLDETLKGGKLKG